MRLRKGPDFFTIPRGVLRLTRIAPSPNRSPDAGVYLFVGDAWFAPIETIWPDEGDALPGRRADEEQPFRLTILHFNDLHGHIAGFTPQGPQPLFSRLAGQIQNVRAQVQNHPRRGLLVFSGGDDSVGSPFDTLLGDSVESFQLHAAYRLYSAVGVDAGVMGNHDLDLSARLLAEALIADAGFPLLTANLAGCSWLSGLYFPAALFVVKGLRVAVAGVTTPAQMAPQPDSTLTFVHPVDALRNLLPALHAVSDVIIVLSHLGYSLAASSASVLLAGDRELAAALPHASVHAIIGGHTHQALNEQGLSLHNVVNGIPILQAGKLGEYLGRADITVVRNHAAVTDVQLTPTRHLPVDEAFERTQVQPLVQKMRPIFDTVLGNVVDDPALSTEAVRNDFARGESPLADFVADALVEQCRLAGHNVDFAAVDASAIATGLPSGRLCYADWFAVMPFADTIRLCTITGEQLHRVLLDNAMRADRIGEVHIERGFLHFSRSIRYRIRLGPVRQQATALAIAVHGAPLDEQLHRTFTVACTSFMQMPAGAWQQEAVQHLHLDLFDLRVLPKVETRLFLRHQLLAYIARHEGVTAAGGACCDGRLVFED